MEGSENTNKTKAVKRFREEFPDLGYEVISAKWKRIKEEKKTANEVDLQRVMEKIAEATAQEIPSLRLHLSKDNAEELSKCGYDVQFSGNCGCSRVGAFHTIWFDRDHVPDSGCEREECKSIV